MNQPFIEIDYFQTHKAQQHVPGDAFLSKRLKDEQRIVSVLSDGLGSGVKANVLSTLTATMALNYASNNFDIRKTAHVIMKTLPVCSTRKISYSTFSIVDIDAAGHAKVIEYDNPSFMLIRNGKLTELPKETIELDTPNKSRNILKFSEFDCQLGDRLVLISDGVSQSGMGTPQFPLGWGEPAVGDFVCRNIVENSDISARDLARRIVQRALTHDKNRANDDITCGIFNIRQPRELMVVSGPPIAQKKDPELARIVQQFEGNKIICGGTTANIVAREWNQKIEVNLKDFSREVPPTSRMNGVDLITEGTITLAKVIEILERDKFHEPTTANGAEQLVSAMLNSDIIHFVVGTKINDAHQDPNVPVELEIRRNIFKHIIRIMEEKHLKSTTLQFI